MTSQTDGAVQTAEIVFRTGSFSGELRVRATPSGLLAIGGLVACVLLSTSALVWAATSVKRKHPLVTAIGR